MSKSKQPATIRSRRARTTRHGLRLEGLENRKMMAAAIMDAASTDTDPILPTASLSSAISAPTETGPIAFIVNGEQTSGYESVGIVNDGCTGTLISPTHVLTAAHCVESNGGGFIGDRDGTFQVNGETYRTVKVTPHPDYNPNDFAAGFDLAIMELDRPVTGVTPSEINRTVPQVGQTMTLVGFGEAGTSNNPSYGFGVKHVGTTPIETVTNEHISWVLDSTDESATAPGDSGGPAFISVDGKLVVAGVTSGGSGDAHSIGAESFDTRVDTLASWIDAQVGTTTPVTPVDPTVPIDPVDPVDPVDPGNPGNPANDFATELATQELADYDTDGDGALSLVELTNEFIDYGDSNSEAAMYAQWLMQDFDSDGNGVLDLNELIVSWGGEPIHDNPAPVAPSDPVDPADPVDPITPVAPVDEVSDAELSDAELSDAELSDAELSDAELSDAELLAIEELDLYDTNNDGSLSITELTNEFIDLDYGEADAKDFALMLIQEFDFDGNDSLSFPELVASWGGSYTQGVNQTGNDELVDDWSGDFDGGWFDTANDQDLWGDEDDWWSSAFLLN